MSDLQTIIKQEPFLGKLQFASDKEIGEFLKSVRTVYSDMADLFNCKKMLKNSPVDGAVTFFEVDPTVKGDDMTFTVSGEGDALLFFTGEALNSFRTFSKIGDNRLIAVLRGFDISELFTDKKVIFGKNGREVREAKPIDKVVINFDLPSSKTSGSYADAFCRSASLVSYLLEQRLLALCGKEVDERETPKIKEIVEALALSDERGIFSAVVKAQVLLAKLNYENAGEYELDNDVRVVAEVLKRLSPKSSLAECRFSAAKALVEFYAKVVSADIKNNLLLPKYNERLKKLTVLFDALPDAFLKDFSPYKEAEIYEVLSKLCGDPQAQKLCEDALETVKKLNAAYYYIYGGRKKRASFTPENLAFAIREGGYLAKGLLKYLSDGGITEALVTS